MDPRIAGQRRGAIVTLVFFVLLLGVVSGVLISTGLDWIPRTVAQSETASNQPITVEPNEFLTSTQESFRALVTAVRPAVVSIQAEGVEGEEFEMYRFGDPFDLFGIPDPFSPPKGPDQERDNENKFYNIPQVSSGSGFMVDPDGYILTNNHVVTGADKIKVILDDGREFVAELIGSDPDTDIAVLKIEDDDPLPYISLGDSDALEVGDWVMAIGNPFGNLAGTVTVGIVSATNREYLQLPGNTYYQNFIQTDAAINLGNSGGPLVDMYGRAVGINTAISAQGSGIGFATPINLVKFVYENFREYGEVVRGWVGVTIQNLDSDLADVLGMGNIRGALVAEVREGDPAERAGLRPGDVILEVEGQRVNSTQTASRLIAGLPVDKPAEFLIWRDGEEISIDITPARRDQDFPGPYQDDQGEEEEIIAPEKPLSSEEYLGIVVKELTQDEISYYELPEDTSGVIITDIEPGGPAFEKGLREGIVIVGINHEPVEDLKDYRNLMAEAKEDWDNDGSRVVIRYMAYGALTGWVRQFMALPFE